MALNWKDIACVTVMVGAVAALYAVHEHHAGIAWSESKGVSDGKFEMARICSKIMDARKTVRIMMENDKGASSAELSRVERILSEAENDLNALMEKRK